MSAFQLGRAGRDSSELLYGSAPRTGLDDFIGRLIVLIPADVVAGYVAVSGFIPISARFGAAPWVVAGVFLVLTPILVVLGRMTRARGTGEPRKLPFVEMAAATIAFLVWVFSLPGSPFDVVIQSAVWLKPLALIATTILLAAIVRIDELGR